MNVSHVDSGIPWIPPLPDDYLEEVQEIINSYDNHPKAFIRFTENWALVREFYDDNSNSKNLKYRNILESGRQNVRIQQYILENDLTNSFVVTPIYTYEPSEHYHSPDPDYWEETYILAHKQFEMSCRVARPAPRGISELQEILGVRELQMETSAVASTAFLSLYPDLGSRGLQVRNLCNGAPQQTLTTKQAAELARMCILGLYKNLDYNNIFFDTQGRVAISITEQEHVLNQHPAHVIAEIAKLKLYCSEEALKVVKNIERKYALHLIISEIKEIALIFFAVTVFTLLGGLIMYPHIAEGMLLSSPLAMIGLPLLLKTPVVSICKTLQVWRWSTLGIKGMQKIMRMNNLV